MIQKQCTLSRNQVLNFEIRSFTELSIWKMILSWDARQVSSWVASASQSQDEEGKQPILSSGLCCQAIMLAGLGVLNVFSTYNIYKRLINMKPHYNFKKHLYFQSLCQSNSMRKVLLPLSANEKHNHDKFVMRLRNYLITNSTSATRRVHTTMFTSNHNNNSNTYWTVTVVKPYNVPADDIKDGAPWSLVFWVLEASRTYHSKLLFRTTHLEKVGCFMQNPQDQNKLQNSECIKIILLRVKTQSKLFPIFDRDIWNLFLYSFWFPYTFLISISQSRNMRHIEVNKFT
jgi:hypothetical protein